MNKILGLDLGTNSIGWAIVEENGTPYTKQNFTLLNKGTHIFAEGVEKEKGKEFSSAAKRTQFRSARRMYFRRRFRKQHTLKVLIENKMCPLTLEQLYGWENNKANYPKNIEFLNWLKTDDKTGINPYYLRDKVSKGKCSLYDVGRAMYHLAQRRGYASNKKDVGDDALFDDLKILIKDILITASEISLVIESLTELKENYVDENSESKLNDRFNKLFNQISKLYPVNKKTKKGIINISYSDFSQFADKIIAVLDKKENLGEVESSILDLTEEMKTNNCETIGQLFYQYYKNKNKRIRSRYTSRELHYLHEFEVICRQQGFNKINESEKFPQRKYSGLVRDLYNAIFYQRPLKSQKGLVGKCVFEKNLPRCPISNPFFEEYRTCQFINNIKFKNSEDIYQNLSTEQIKIIEPLFYRKSKPSFKFEDIHKKLGTDLHFNFKDRDSVKGNYFASNLKFIFGEDWKNEIFNQYKLKEKFIDKKIGTKTLKTIDDIILDFWHILFSSQSEADVKNFATKNLNLTDKQLIAFCKLKMKQGYTSLSLKAIRKILIYLKQHFGFSHAVFVANIDEVIPKKLWDDPKNKKIIIDEIKSIINNFKETKKRVNVVNDFIFTLKEKLNSNINSYTLTPNDEKYILSKTLDYFGKITFNAFSKEKQTEISSWILSETQNQINKNSFSNLATLQNNVYKFLEDNFGVTEKQCKLLYHPSQLESSFKGKILDDQKMILDSPKIPSIKNPMALRALHRLKKLINTLIINGKIDGKTKIHLELSRNLNDANMRAAINWYKRDREKNREKIIERIIKECGIVNPTDTDILRYQLWDEQNNNCLYTGIKISLSSIIGGAPQFDIEHTLPRGLSQDNSQQNKTLANEFYNKHIKKDYLPCELPNFDKEAVLVINGENVTCPPIKNTVGLWKIKYEDYEKLYKAYIKAKNDSESIEDKNKRIQRKHYYKMHFDYWKGKYDRFFKKEIPEGFKNSQIVDTGIITKYARSFLKSVFGKVYCYKGELTNQFRKVWGIQDEHEKKSRVNHTHHTIDAITLACITKQNYEILAHAWGLEEKGNLIDSKNELSKTKPWKTFVEDLKNIENEVIVTHYSTNYFKNQSKKKRRIRNKIFKKNGKPIYLKGDTSRLELHEKTFYGAIAHNALGVVRFDDENNVIPNLVLRTKLTDLSEKDVESIVDKKVKGIIKQAIIDNKIEVIKDMLKPKEKIWMNKEKNIEINKVRIYTFKKSSINLKLHRDLSKKPYKQHIKVTNAGNQFLVIYEGTDNKNKISRESELIGNLDVGMYYRLSNKKERGLYPLFPQNSLKNNLPVKYLLKKGLFVLLWENSPEEIWDLNPTQLVQRLYKITQLDTEGQCIKLLYHQEARPGTLIGQPKGGKLIGEFREKPKIKLSPNQFDALVEGYDFKISIDGIIEKLNC